jgi:uncharacterized protein with GYD domain
MATFFMFGEYSQDAVEDISADRTEETIALIEKNGGELKAGYALLGDKDLVLIVELPDTEAAIRTSVALSKMLEIGFSTSPAVTIATFDKLVEQA